MFDINTLVGHTEVEAAKKLAKHGFKMRIVKRDGVVFYGSEEFDKHRVNVVVEHGIIKEVLGIN